MEKSTTAESISTQLDIDLASGEMPEKVALNKALDAAKKVMDMIYTMGDIEAIPATQKLMDSIRAKLGDAY